MPLSFVFKLESELYKVEILCIKEIKNKKIIKYINCNKIKTKELFIFKAELMENVTVYSLNLLELFHTCGPLSHMWSAQICVVNSLHFVKRLF